MQRISDRLTRASFSSSGLEVHTSGATPNLFAYGTLTIDKVVLTLLDRVPEFHDASATGWRAARLPGLLYPGLVADADSVARGRVYTDLNWDEWVLLDAFEDAIYELESIEFMPAHGTALAYVWPEEVDGLAWVAASLTQHELSDYIERCSRWRESHTVDSGGNSAPALAPKHAQRRWRKR